jgi:hypothetical protein
LADVITDAQPQGIIRTQINIMRWQQVLLDLIFA